MFEDVISALAKVLGDISQGHKGWALLRFLNAKGNLQQEQKGCPEMTYFLGGGGGGSATMGPE